MSGALPALLSHDVPGGAAWSVQVRAGRALHLTALDDRANCSTLIFAARDPVDRLEVPDTLKAQMSACVQAPMVLMSDRGVGLCSVTRSSLGWHDCLGVTRWMRTSLGLGRRPTPLTATNGAGLPEPGW